MKQYFKFIRWMLTSSLKTLGSKITGILPGLIGSIVGFILKTAESVIRFLDENAWILIMRVVIFMVERFQENKRYIKNADTSPAEINANLIISRFFSLSLKLHVSSLFEGWEVGLLIFDDLPSICLTPTDVISKFTDLLTPGFIWAIALFILLPYPTVLWVSRRRSEGIGQGLGESARSSPTLAASITSWNLWTLLCLTMSMSYILIAFSTDARNLYWASFALPDEPTIDDLTLTYEPRMQQMNASIDWLNLVLPAYIRPFKFISHEEVKLTFNFHVVIPYEVDQIAFDGFSTIITELVITRIRIWSCWWSQICKIYENRPETVIITLFEAEVRARWNSKLRKYSFERGVP